MLQHHCCGGVQLCNRGVQPFSHVLCGFAASVGAPFFLQHGTRIINRLKDFLRVEYTKQGYDEVMTPIVFNKSIWEQSGHWEHYSDDMFFVSVCPLFPMGEGTVLFL